MNIDAWIAVVVLCIVMDAASAVYCAVLIVQHWMCSKDRLSFPRLNLALWTLITLLTSSVFMVISFAWDPYLFLASEGGWLTRSYAAGKTVDGAIGIPLLAVAYGMDDRVCDG